MNKNNQPIITPKYLIIFAISIVWIYFSAYTETLISFNQLKTNNNVQMIPQQYSAKLVSLEHKNMRIRHDHMRILTQEERSKQITKSESNQNDNKSFFLTIVIIVVVFFVLGIACCAICIIRYICMSERSYFKGSVANIKVNHDIIFPPLSLSLFSTYVGQPFQTDCVICLQDFHFIKNYQINEEMQNIHENSKFNSQIKQQTLNQQNMALKNTVSMQSGIQKTENMGIKIMKSQQYIQSSKLPNYDNQIVKFTVCGHLLHSKCLEDWLQRLQICPLCRQQFSYQNIDLWENKLKMSFQDQYHKFLRKGPSLRRKKSFRETNRQQTLAQIARSISKNDILLNDRPQQIGAIEYIYLIYFKQIQIMFN